MESLTEERLQELREMFMAEKDTAKRAEITTEGKRIRAYLENNKWGSKEVGGNGYCHTCHTNSARVSHYNCLGCAGKLQVNNQSRTVSGMQQALLEMARDKELTSGKSLESIINDVFEIR